MISRTGIIELELFHPDPDAPREAHGGKFSGDLHLLSSLVVIRSLQADGFRYGDFPSEDYMPHQVIGKFIHTADLIRFARDRVETSFGIDTAFVADIPFFKVCDQGNDTKRDVFEFL